MKYTDFRQFSHAELRAMVQALNPGEVMAAADPWRRAADTLKAIRTTLTRASTEAATTWEGTTSDAFHTRMLHLATTINTAASYANDAAITLKAVSEAIAEAKRNMPEEPSGWAQFKDGVGDTFSSLFGADDEDARTDLANQKKAEAATVLQTLAMHYRTAAPMLKPPPPPGAPPKLKEEVHDVPDSSGGDGAAAAGALMAGASFTGPASGGGSDRNMGPSPRAVGRSTVPLPKGAEGGTSSTALPPGDSGIKGGTPQAPSKRPSVTNVGPGVSSREVGPPSPLAKTPSNTNVGPGVGIDGGTPAPVAGGAGAALGPVPSGPGSSVPSPSAAGIPWSPAANGFSAGGGPGRGPGGGLVFEGEDAAVRGAAGPARQGRGSTVFGASGVPTGGFTASAPGSSPRRAGTGLPRSGGGVVGEEGSVNGGSSGRRAFTEGGSGIGFRGRMRAEGTHVGGLQQVPGMGPVPIAADTRGRRKEQGRDGKRPDYLVEDEETWIPAKPVNPNVVE